MHGDSGLRGARVAFTGRLASMTRREALGIVRDAGGTPSSSVSGTTTHLVIGASGWPLDADGALSAKLRRAETLRERRGRISILPEVRFLELAGLRARAPDVRKSYPVDRVAELVGVDARTIERWEYLGLVRSEEGAYDFQDIVSLQTIAMLVRQGVQLARIQRSLESLASFLPGTERPLAQLEIIGSDTGDLLARVGETLVTPDGQQVLEFDRPSVAPEGGVAREASAEAGETRTARAVGAVRRVEAWRARGAGAAGAAGAAEEEDDDDFERAVRLEDEERYEEATDAYRQAIAEDPRRAEAYFNLGNVLRMSGRVEAAEELYLLALALDPADELAWYNLADLQEEAGRCEEAVESLRRAVETSPMFADGHFNLAACLEQIGDHAAASDHWRAYLALDPASEWASVARERLRVGRD